MQTSLANLLWLSHPHPYMHALSYIPTIRALPLALVHLAPVLASRPSLMHRAPTSFHLPSTPPVPFSRSLAALAADPDGALMLERLATELEARLQTQ